MRSCFCCSLLQGCRCVAGYHFVSACLGVCAILFSFVNGETTSLGIRTFEVIFPLVIFIAALGLVYGLKRKDRCLLLSWMIVQSVRIVLEVVILIILIYTYAVLDDHTYGDVDVGETANSEETAHSDNISLMLGMNAAMKVRSSLLICYIIAITADIILNIICLEAIRSYRAVLAGVNGVPVIYQAPEEDQKRGLV